jgi:hypothetical protein
MEDTTSSFVFSFTINHWNRWRDCTKAGHCSRITENTQQERIAVWKAAKKVIDDGYHPNMPPSYGNNDLQDLLYKNHLLAGRQDGKVMPIEHIAVFKDLFV